MLPLIYVSSVSGKHSILHVVTKAVTKMELRKLIKTKEIRNSRPHINL